MIQCGAKVVDQISEQNRHGSAVPISLRSELEHAGDLLLDLETKEAGTARSL